MDNKVELKDIVKVAYENGFFEVDKNDGDACVRVHSLSGENYFYAFGNDAEEYFNNNPDKTAEDYINYRTPEGIYEDIANVLRDFIYDDDSYNVEEALWYLNDISEANYNCDNKKAYDEALNEWIDKAEFAEFVKDYRDAEDKEYFLETIVNNWIDVTFQKKGYIINPDIDFSKDLVPESDDLFYEGNEETHACDFEFQTESMDMNKIFPDFYNYITTYFEDIDTYSYMNFYANLSEKDNPSIDLIINFETNKINARIPMTEKQFDDLRKVLIEYREQEEQQIERD